MLLRCVARHARRKHGQRVWNPNASPQGAAPATGVTAAEALQIAYRPMPLAQTVEYEEDFGANLMIHREYISTRNREAMDFQLSGLAYSDTELSSGRQHFARMMNRERAGAVVGSGGKPADCVDLQVAEEELSAGQPGNGRRGATARYVFDATRLAYCERFSAAIQGIEKRSAVVEKHGTKEEASHGGTSTSPLFSLMEACAVLYGCETREAQETYLKMFLGLSTEQLEEDVGGSFVESIQSASTSTNTSACSSPLPSIFDAVEDLKVQKEAGKELRSSLRVEKEMMRSKEEMAGEVAFSAAPSSPKFTAIAGPHEEPVFGSYNISEIASKEHLQVRRRWRQIIEKLVNEDYHLLTPQEYGNACILNHQLHTVKFLDFKVGDSIKEMMSVLQEDNRRVSSSVHRDSPGLSSSTNPENRE